MTTLSLTVTCSSYSTLWRILRVLSWQWYIIVYTLEWVIYLRSSDRGNSNRYRGGSDLYYDSFMDCWGHRVDSHWYSHCAHTIYDVRIQALYFQKKSCERIYKFYLLEQHFPAVPILFIQAFRYLSRITGTPVTNPLSMKFNFALGIECWEIGASDFYTTHE